MITPQPLTARPKTTGPMTAAFRGRLHRTALLVLWSMGLGLVCPFPHESLAQIPFQETGALNAHVCRPLGTTDPGLRPPSQPNTFSAVRIQKQELTLRLDPEQRYVDG